MKHFFSLALIACLWVLPIQAVSAQAPTPKETLEEVVLVQPVISTKSEIEVGKKLILDASKSSIPEGSDPTYTWEIDTGNEDTGREVVARFDTPGVHTITLHIDINKKRYSSSTTVFAYTQVVSFLYNGDPNLLDTNIPAIRELAEKQGIFLNVIHSTSGSALLQENGLTQMIQSDIEPFQNSQVIIGGPDGTGFLTALAKVSHVGKGNNTPLIDLRNKTIITSTRENLWLQTRAAERISGRISPASIVILERDPFSTLNFYLQATTKEAFLKKFSPKEVEILDRSPQQDFSLLFLSRALNIGITNGIPSEVLIFILFMPFLMTINVFLKQVVGVETLGIFRTIVLTLSFLILGLSLGTLTFVVTLFVGILVRKLLRKTPILYVARTALLLSFSALAVLFLISYGSQWGLLFGLDASEGEQALLSIFPMILIAIQADKLSLMGMSRRMKREDLIHLASTYAAVVIGYVLMKINFFELILLAMPELVIVAFICIYMIGRYTGLRVVEYFRFRELFKHEIEE